MFLTSCGGGASTESTKDSAAVEETTPADSTAAADSAQLQ
jgi:hypothetical protein